MDIKGCAILALMGLTSLSMNPLAASAADDPFSILNFRVNLLVVSQLAAVDGWFTYTPQIAWSPSYHFPDVLNQFQMKALLAYAPLRSLDSTRIDSMSCEGMLGYTFSRHYEIEGGGGIQTWLNYGTSGIVSGNLVWKVVKGNSGLIDRIFIGYSRHFAVLGDDQYRLGIGIAL